MRYEETVFLWISQIKWDKLGPRAFFGRFYWIYRFIRNILLSNEICRMVSQISYWLYRFIRNFFFASGLMGPLFSLFNIDFAHEEWNFWKWENDRPWENTPMKDFTGDKTLWSDFSKLCQEVFHEGLLGVDLSWHKLYGRRWFQKTDSINL